jgi:hypothetical protein
MKSTPSTPSLTMRVTALDPPPPRPTTLIRTALAEKFDLAIYLSSYEFLNYLFEYCL